MDARPTKLFVALPSYGGMEAAFVQCLVKLMLDPPCALQVGMTIGDSLVSRARNSLTAQFLKSNCTHLLFIDTDLIFSSEHVARLLAHGVPVVGGFYPKKQDGPLNWVCNALPDFPAVREDGLQPLRYLGTGFLMVERAVFESMIEALGETIAFRCDSSGELQHDLWPVGVRQFEDGAARYLSEDWYFCQRCLDLGIDVLGDTRVILKHVGNAVYPLQSQVPALLAKEA